MSRSSAPKKSSFKSQNKWDLAGLIPCALPESSLEVSSVCFRWFLSVAGCVSNLCWTLTYESWSCVQIQFSYILLSEVYKSGVFVLEQAGVRVVYGLIWISALYEPRILPQLVPCPNLQSGTCELNHYPIWIQLFLIKKVYWVERITWNVIYLF